MCGIAGIVRWDGRPVAEDEHYLSRIAVQKDQRGRGLGGLLLARVLEETERLGLRRCVLDVDPASAAAVALYRSAGFAQTGEHAVVDPETGLELRYARFSADVVTNPIA